MDLIENWAIKIASEIAPDEVDLAPEMTIAYLAGGEDREQLYKQSTGGGLGGFGGADIQAVYPVILNCITVAGSGLITILSVQNVGTILSVVKVALEIKGMVERQKKASELLSGENHHLLKQTLDTFSNGLRSTGFSQDQCDLMAHRFMVTLLENPTSAQEFIKLFKATPGQTKKSKQKRK